MIFHSSLVTLLNNMQYTIRSMKRKRDTTTNVKHTESIES